jgi:hypothetical protein
LNDPVIEALKKEQLRVANEFFRRPPKQQNIAYEYGVAFGTYAGLELAIQRILALYRDDKVDTFD